MRPAGGRPRANHRPEMTPAPLLRAAPSSLAAVALAAAALLLSSAPSAHAASRPPPPPPAPPPFAPYCEYVTNDDGLGCTLTALEHRWDRLEGLPTPVDYWGLVTRFVASFAFKAGGLTSGNYSASAYTGGCDATCCRETASPPSEAPCAPIPRGGARGPSGAMFRRSRAAARAPPGSSARAGWRWTTAGAPLAPTSQSAPPLTGRSRAGGQSPWQPTAPTAGP